MKIVLPENQRILHLAQDEKFIDMALQAFERICPGHNDVFLLADTPLRFVKQPPLRIFSVSDIGDDKFIKLISAYPMVVVHSLNPNFVKIINRVEKSVSFFWIGWGYDYYDLVYKNENELLLCETKKYSDTTIPKKNLLWHFYNTIKKIHFKRKKFRAITRISCFSTEVPSEFQRVKNAVACNPFPQYLAWNYGTLEDDLTGVFKDAVCTGSNILIGNSAALTNNHLDMIDQLKNMGTGTRKIIAPLSYGDMNYAQMVKHYGEDALGEYFQPIMDFLPIEQYVDIVQSCGFVMMGHLRQQAFGNLVIMLYMGAKVFLHEKNPYYAFYQSQGVVLYTMQMLENDASHLNVPLNDAQKRGNRLVMERLWSRSAVDERTSMIIQALMAAGKKHRPVQQI